MTAPIFPPVLIESLAKSIDKDQRESTKRRRTIGRAFVKPAEEALKAEAGEHALRLGAAGALIANDVNLKLVPELWSPVARANIESKTTTVLRGHDGTVRMASFSPEGRRIVTASEDTTARVWEAETGTQIVVLKGHDGLAGR